MGSVSRAVQAKPERIAMALEGEIRSGKLRFGARLESESELVRRFAVSRTTVRKSLEVLAGKGLITTRMGIGSFVTFDGEVIDNALGWTRALANRKEAVETTVLHIGVIHDETLARQMKLENRTFIAIDRTRSLKESGRVVSIERSRVPLRPELKDVPLSGLSHGSLSRTLTDAGLIGHGGEEWVEIESLSKADADLAGVSAGTPFLRTRRVVRDRDGRLIEYVVSYLDPSHFALHMEF